MISNIKTLAALLMAGAAFTACSSSDDVIEQPANQTEPQVYTLVIKASKGDANTRALSLSGSTLNAYWSGEETIEVYQNDVKIGTATAAASDDGKTTITAELDPAPDPTKDLDFFLGGYTPDYTGQNGLLTGDNSISEKYDYAMGWLGSGSYTVDEVNYTVTPNENTSLEFGAAYAEQAVIKFTLQDKGNSNAAISPSAFTVSDGTSTVELTSIPATTYSANGAGVLFVAFPATNYLETITLTATVGNDTYTYTKWGAKFEKGQYYEITVKMTKQLGHALTSAVVGDIVGSDGLAYAAADKDNLPSGVTAVAVITYVGEAGTADASSATYKGLALALTDANNGDEAAWCSQYSVTCLNTQYANKTDAKGDMAGIANTNALLGHASHTHTAASVARNYNGGTHPTGTSEWFLPSAGQWDKMITAASGFENLRTNASLQSGNNWYSYYWSSTEYTKIGAWLCYFEEYDGGWQTDDKDHTNYVRSALAF